MVSTTKNLIFSRAAIARLLIGWGAVLLMAFAAPLFEPQIPVPLLVSSLGLIIAVILVCSFGVVNEAEHLARRLGDPYGSLVLTLSIVLIEVVLISAILLGPGEHATIARDSVMAVSMIILNAVVGLALLVGGLRHGHLVHNRTGTSSYMSMIIVLASLAFALPALIGANGSYTVGQAIPIIVLTLGVYAFFLAQQMGKQAVAFREVDPRFLLNSKTDLKTEIATERQPIAEILREHRAEVLLRLGLLVVTVLPIVLLSHNMAALLDDGLSRMGAPVALSGVLIAMIVFLPESITTVRAALSGEAQRVTNLCHGAAVSTVGLTIPAVLLIGMLTDQQIVLAESPANLLILGVTLLLSVSTFSAKKVTAMHGATHLVLFAVYGLVIFS